MGIVGDTFLYFSQKLNLGETSGELLDLENSWRCSYMEKKQPLHRKPDVGGYLDES
jgi:hypothetical protein